MAMYKEFPSLTSDRPIMTVEIYWFFLWLKKETIKGIKSMI
jgi:hypothetical protein